MQIDKKFTLSEWELRFVKDAILVYYEEVKRMQSFPMESTFGENPAIRLKHDAETMLERIRSALGN